MSVMKTDIVSPSDPGDTARQQRGGVTGTVAPPAPAQLPAVALAVRFEI